MARFSKREARDILIQIDMLEVSMEALRSICRECLKDEDNVLPFPKIWPGVTFQADEELLKSIVEDDDEPVL